MTLTPDERRARDRADLKARRFVTGCIATLVRGDEVLTRHFVGNKTDATRAVAAFCDAGGWKVRCLSTPETILRDLGGSRAKESNAPVYGTTYSVVGPTPEGRMLGAIGRLDLRDG